MATITKKYGESVTLTATPNSGYEFSSWSGDASGSTNPLTITVLGDMSVTGNFSVVQSNVIRYTLTPGSAAISSGWINTNTDTSRNTYDSTTGVGQLYLNQGVNKIGTYAFEYIDDLLSIELPSNITSIGNDAFRGCSRLVSITLPSGFQEFDWSYALAGTAIETITIPSSTISLGSYTFYGTPLKNVIGLENSLVTSIPRGCFRNTHLESITLPSSLTAIREYAFDGAFNNLYVRPAVSLTIPANVEEIEERAFFGCDRISSLTCLATTPPTLTGTEVFDGMMYTTLYVPSASLSAYQNDADWSGYFSNIQAIQ